MAVARVEIIGKILSIFFLSFIGSTLTSNYTINILINHDLYIMMA